MSWLIYQPEWLYRVKPLLCLLLGIWAGVQLTGSLATLSAVLLVVSGLLILSMRYGLVSTGAG